MHEMKHNELYMHIAYVGTLVNYLYLKTTLYFSFPFVILRNQNKWTKKQLKYNFILFLFF